MTQPRVPRPPEPDGPGRQPLVHPGRRIILGDPSQVLGRSWGQLLAWVVLVAGAGVDVATFYQVLILVMNAPEEVVWGAVIGFTAIALALAHRVGTLAGDATNPRNVVGAKVTAWVCFAIWLSLGVTGFLVRMLVQAADVGGGSTILVDGQPMDVGGGAEATSQYLSALLFLVLYLATGMVSGLVGYLRPHPAARLWKRALRKRTRAARRYANSQSRLVTAQKLAEAIEKERTSRKAAYATAEQQCDETAAQLKQEVRRKVQAARRPPPSAPFRPRPTDGIRPGGRPSIGGPA